MIVDPMVIAAPGLPENDSMVFKAMAVEPFFCDGAVLFRPGSEKGNDMAFVVPLIQDL